MRWRLIPREEGFFDDFVALARETLSAAQLLEAMLAPERPALERAAEINEIEREDGHVASRGGGFIDRYFGISARGSTQRRGGDGGRLRSQHHVAQHR